MGKYIPTVCDKAKEEFLNDISNKMAYAIVNNKKFDISCTTEDFLDKLIAISKKSKYVEIK